MKLFLRSGSDFSIVDEQGRIYTTEEAKAVWVKGEVTDYNLAFYRLVTLGFDLEATKQHYLRGGR